MRRHGNGSLFGDGFTENPEDDKDAEPGDNHRCTPELLLEFLQKHRRLTGHASPTLKELKQEFGGILGPMLDAWELERRGLLKEGRV